MVRAPRFNSAAGSTITDAMLKEHVRLIQLVQLIVFALPCPI
jgi:hypothetical protein